MGILNDPDLNLPRFNVNEKVLGLMIGPDFEQFDLGRSSRYQVQSASFCISIFSI